MFRRRIAFAGLSCAVAMACGERIGEPIVAVEAPPLGGDGNPPGAGTGTGGGAPSGTSGAAAGSGTPAAGGDVGEPVPPGPLGLCAPCAGSEFCGDADDACLRQGTELFCGRDCEEGLGCPDGYQCVQLENARLWQCVPSLDCPGPTAAPAIAEVRTYVLERLNAERAALDRPPLIPSSCLDDLAQASALEYASTGRRHAKFARECQSVWPNCSCGWLHQGEAMVAEWGLDWIRAVEYSLSGDELDDFLDRTLQGVGIGFWTSGDEAWIALSFR